MKKFTKYFVIISLIVAGISTGVAIPLALNLSSGGNKIPYAKNSFIEVYKTTGTKSKIMSREKDLRLTNYDEYSTNATVYVGDEPLEEFDGYGMAVTHSSAYLLMNTSEENRQEILSKLFGDTGAKFNAIRFPIGTSDFTLNSEPFYSLDDIQEGTDYELSQFSIDKDQRFLIPAIKEILKINPSISIMATPWSAPGWMKSTESLVGGSIKGFENTELDNPSLEEKAYAKYLLKAIQAYRQEGINIDHLSIVNEPFIGSVQYPSMRLEGTQNYRIAKELVSLFKTEEISDVKITAFDHNVTDEVDTAFELYVQPLLEDEAISSYIDSFAVHTYSGRWPTIYEGFLESGLQNYDQKFFISEMTETQDSVDFAQNLAWSASNVTIGPVGLGISKVLYWNMLLDSDGGPVKGNGAKLFGVVTLDDDRINFNPAYYAMAHTSQFLDMSNGQKPHHLSTSSTNFATIKACAFDNDKKTQTITVVNTSDKSTEEVNVVLAEKYMTTISIEPQSVVTLIVKNNADAFYEPISFLHINIYQKQYATYDFSIDLDKNYSGVEFYISPIEKYSEADKVDSVSLVNNQYTFVANIEPGDCYLFVKNADNSGHINLTIPSMMPQIEYVGSENEYIECSFGLNRQTSWSSFCDPFGKSLYRSSASTFDITATKINLENLAILTEEYVDTSPSLDEPYYYFVMDGKNDITTFYSSSVTFKGNIIQENSEIVDLVNIDNKPYLTYQASYLGNDLSSLHLLVKDNADFRVSSPIQDDVFPISLDLTSLPNNDIWYDVMIEDGNGVPYWIDDSAASNMAKSLIIDGRIYEFKEYDHLLKVNCRQA